MQVIVNERLAKRESTIGAVFLGVTFVVLLLSLLLSREVEARAQQSEPWVPIAIAYAIVIVGMAMFYLGNSRIRRFGPQHRQDARLKRIMKGLDDRYALFAFLGRGLPDYVLLGPGGLSVLTMRPHNGEIACRDDRWTHRTGPLRRIFGSFYGTTIGNPSYESARAVKKVKTMLDHQGVTATQDITVNGLIIFTGDRVRLRVERCTYPATTAREARKVVGKQKNILSAAQLAELKSAFEAVLHG